MNSMFYNCRNLRDISGLANLQTENLKDLNAAFQNCSALTSLHGMETWNLPKLTSMSCTFQDAGLQDISALKDWNAPLLSNLCQTFNGCQFESVEALANWNTTEVSGLAGTFQNNPRLKSLHGLETWSLPKCTNVTDFVTNCTGLTDVLALGNWTTLGNWCDIHTMLMAPNIEEIDLSGLNTEKIAASSTPSQAYIFMKTPVRIKLSTSYLTGRSNFESTHFIKGSLSSGNETYVSASLDGPYNAQQILDNWNEETMTGWWGRAVEMTFADGLGNTVKKSLPARVEVSMPDNLFENEKTFLGWQDENGVEYQAGAAFTAQMNEGQTFTAIYEPDPVTYGSVAYEANGGSGVMEAQSVVVGEAAKLNANAFVRPNYRFTGWNTSVDGSGTALNDEGEVILSNEGTITLYAQWERIMANIAYEANGGTGSMEAQSVPINEAVNLNASTFTRPNYRFIGWNTSADGTGTPLGDAGEVTINGEGTVTLYAQWERTTAAISFDANGGTGTMDNQIVNHGELTPIAGNAFVKEDYAFVGWNTRADGSGTGYKAGDSISIGENTSALTLYAQWRKATGTISFDANGGEGAMENQKGVFGETLVLPASAFVKAGYTFEGWNTKADGSGTDYANEASIAFDADKDGLVLYAKWAVILDSSPLHVLSNQIDECLKTDVWNTVQSTQLQLLKAQAKTAEETAQSQQAINDGAKAIHERLLNLRIAPSEKAMNDL